jgi:NADH-quinone oxidoreductase subunit J
MADTLFLILSVLTVACALLVVLNKNSVNAAMFLLVSLVGMAGLFVLLDAPLLAFVLLLVYAGAVVALFLFIIMLLDTTPGSFKSFNKLTIAASVLGAALLGLGILTLFKRGVLPQAPQNVPMPTLQDYAAQLFTTYLLPVQIVGFMLLIAMLGVIVLSKRFETKGGAS